MKLLFAPYKVKAEYSSNYASFLQRREASSSTKWILNISQRPKLTSSLLQPHGLSTATGNTISEEDVGYENTIQPPQEIGRQSVYHHGPGNKVRVVKYFLDKSPQNPRNKATLNTKAGKDIKHWLYQPTKVDTAVKGDAGERLQQYQPKHRWVYYEPKDNAGKEIEYPPQALTSPWIKRIQTQFDTTLRPLQERGQIRRLLTHGERLSVLEVPSGLGEVLNFQQYMKERPRKADQPENNVERFQELLGGDEDVVREEDHSDTLFSFTTGRNLSSYSILAGYIDLKIRERYLAAEHYDKLLLEVFSDEKLWWLRTHGGVTIEDIIAWDWILEAGPQYTAVIRFLVWTNRPMPHCRIPRVIFYMLLKRQLTEPAAINLLTTHLIHRLENTMDHSWEAVYLRFSESGQIQLFPEVTPDKEPQASNYPSIEVWKTAVYILMLIKAAVYTVPILLPTLATMLCKHVQLQGNSTNTREDNLTLRLTTSLTLIFNKAVDAMSWKSAEPFINAPYQERAQFIIIRYMNTFRPPLKIGLEAYRAIVSVQLRHRKTIKERLWTELKSRGWPPYREDKLGIDALKKEEDYGISRAQHAIMNLKEAGFGATEWEDSASVLSGWDMDRSPTIQSRRLLLVPAKIKKRGLREIPRYSLWKHRILATRTIEEAWATFLNYVEEDVPKTPDVFLAMFEKIVKERKRIKSMVSTRSHATSTILAGDMTETLPSSRNPREQTYIPSPSPSFIAFYHQYRTYFPALNAEALCFLLPHAENIVQAYDFVEKSGLTIQQKNVLLRQSIHDRERVEIQSRVVAAYIRMLSNFASNALPNHKSVSALSHALHLVTTYNPRARGPWISLMEVMEKEMGHRKSRSFWIQHWNILLEFLHGMEKAGTSIDSEVFYVVCSIFGRLLRCASKTNKDIRDRQTISNPESATDIKVRTGRMLKRMFKRMVTLDLRTVFCHTNDKLPFLPLSKPELGTLNKNIGYRIDSILPHVLYIPSAPALHLFVRLLGVTDDRKAVFDLVRWMSVYYREIEAKYMDIARGPGQFRQVLIAIRIVMENPTMPFVNTMTLGELSGIDLEYAEQTRHMIDSIDVWGGWPSDQEVEDYTGMQITLKEDEKDSKAVDSHN